MRRSGAAALALALAVAGCSNDPYPARDDARKVYYSAFSEAPRTLDPAVSYNVDSHAIAGSIYETLLEYHYLKRPYELIPGLAEEVPEAEPRPNGRVAYRFRLRPGVIYAADPCFALGAPGRTTREVVAPDVEFELMRIADPAVNSPVVDPFSNVLGFREFQERLVARRKADPAFAQLPVRDQYAAVAPLEGVKVEGDHAIEIVLRGPYPQILYWFAMEFTSPVPWEAVAWYDGREGRDRFADHPVGSGAYRLARYDKQFRIVLEANPDWYGVLHPEWRAPGTVYPAEGEPGDAAAGLLDASAVGHSLPFIERIELWREKESIPRFNKFLQGYYDAQSSIIKESFDRVIQNGRLSPDMAAKGIVLDKSISPGIFYVGINMRDPVLGDPAGARGRKLRQAMSVAVDSKGWIDLFQNGRGIPAQSPVPPTLFGYDPDYRNPYRVFDRDRARRLLREAGLPGGVDPATGKPLELHFDSYSTSSAGLLQEQYLVDGWRAIGLDVKIDATTYNQFQEKIEKGAYQLFFWGWQADYPDPENFLFLLTCDMRHSKSGGPNYANFCNHEFDALFARMRVRGNDAERVRLIEAMTRIVERERPWIEVFYPETFGLYHGWLRNVKSFGMSFPMWKYWDIDPAERAAKRAEWNQPVMWPAWLLGIAAVALVVPGIVTFLRERQ